MSNKYKYFTVTTTSIIKAPSQTEAVNVLKNPRKSNGELLTQSREITRISANEAREWISEESPSMTMSSSR